MYIDPFFSSLLAFVAGIVLLEVTRDKRGSSKGLNFILVATALLLSIFMSAYTSRKPEASGGHLFYLWSAYAVFSMFVRKKKSAGLEADERPNDDAAA
jgi:uncharacterized membrane protein (UPF0136 family)